MKYLVAFIFSTLLIYGCSDSMNEPTSCSTPLETDKMTIEDYIDSNNLTAQSTPEGVYYIIDVPGTSEKPNSQSQVTVNYSGYLLDGSQFDSGNAVTFGLMGVIEGWTIGIPQFGKGGSGTLLIPSTLAYDCDAIGTIPANSILAFDITLIDFQ